MGYVSFLEGNSKKKCALWNWKEFSKRGHQKTRIFYVQKNMGILHKPPTSLPSAQHLSTVPSWPGNCEINASEIKTMPLIALNGFPHSGRHGIQGIIGNQISEAAISLVPLDDAGIFPFEHKAPLFRLLPMVIVIVKPQPFHDWIVEFHRQLCRRNTKEFWWHTLLQL